MTPEMFTQVDVMEMSLQVVSPHTSGLLLLIPRGTCTLLPASSPETRDPSPLWATGETHKGGFSLRPGPLSVIVLFSQQEEQSPLHKQNPTPHPQLNADLLSCHKWVRWGALGEDIVGLVLHQHLHAPHIGAPEFQAVLHPLDLRQTRTTRVLGHLGIPGVHLQLIL